MTKRGRNQYDLILELVEKLEYHVDDGDPDVTAKEQLSDFEDCTSGKFREIDNRLDELEERIEEQDEEPEEDQDIGESDDDPETYECEVCGEQFDDGRGLGGHMSVHRDEEGDEEEPENPESFDDVKLDGDIKDYSSDVRRNFVVALLTRHRENEGKFAGLTAKQIAQLIWDERIETGRSNYNALMTDLREDQRVEDWRPPREDNTGSPGVKKYRVNPRVSESDLPDVE